MDLTTITIDDFKDLFFRDFPYLKDYDNTELYNSGDRVYYSITKLFYDCIKNGTTGVLPTSGYPNWQEVSDSVNNYVLDADITKAFTEAQATFNQALFDNDADIQLAYLYMTAHYLVMDIQASLQGLQSSGSFTVNSRTVGSVSESYGVPDSFTNDPQFAYWVKTQYGMKYLSLIQNRLIGAVFTVDGGTNP